MSIGEHSFGSRNTIIMETDNKPVDLTMAPGSAVRSSKCCVSFFLFILRSGDFILMIPHDLFFLVSFFNTVRFEMGTPVNNSSVDKIFSIDNIFDFGVNSDPFPLNEIRPDFNQFIADFDLSVFESSQDVTEVHTNSRSEIEHQKEMPVFTKTDSLLSGFLKLKSN